MTTEPQVKLLADAISTPIIKAYTTGGYGLSLLTVGAVLLVLDVVSPERNYLAAIVGTVVIASVLAFFWFHGIRTLRQAQKSIHDNRELLNSIQGTAIQMTELSSHLQSLAFKHADEVASVLAHARKTVRQIINVPLIGNTALGRSIAELADHEKVVDAEEMAVSIVDYTEAAKDVIEDVRRALTQLEAEPLTKYREQISELDAQIKTLLRNVA